MTKIRLALVLGYFMLAVLGQLGRVVLCQEKVIFIKRLTKHLLQSKLIDVMRKVALVRQDDWMGLIWGGAGLLVVSGRDG